MGYRIDYQKKRNYGNRNSFRLTALTILCLGLFLFMVETMWPEGALYIRKVIRFTKEALPVSALNSLADELHRSQTIREIVSSVFRSFSS